MPDRTVLANSLFNRYSRYVHGGTTEQANDRLEWWDRTIFPRDASDLVYVVEAIYSGRPDALATVFYGEPRYWWIIAQHNNILDPFSEMVEGRALYIPTKERLTTFLTGKVGGVDSTRESLPLVPTVVT